MALLESPMARPEFSTSVAVRHLPEQSDRDKGQFAFAYTVTIKNSGDVTAQLIAPPLDHQRRERPRRGGARARGRRPPADAEARRVVRVHELDADRDAATAACAARFFCMTEDARSFEAPIAEFGLTLASSLH